MASFTATKRGSWDNASLEGVTSLSIRSFKKIEVNEKLSFDILMNSSPFSYQGS
jgi:hypothetical protein